VCVDKSQTSQSDPTRQLRLLADTYSLTCDIVLRDTAAVAASTDAVSMLADIAGSSNQSSDTPAVNHVR